jgi:hypothetical protein
MLKNAFFIFASDLAPTNVPLNGCILTKKNSSIFYYNALTYLTSSRLEAENCTFACNMWLVKVQQILMMSWSKHVSRSH